MPNFTNNEITENSAVSDIEFGAAKQVNFNILKTLKLDQALNLAKKKIREGAYEEAKQVYRDILNKFPKNKKAQKGLVVLNKPPQEFVNKLIQAYNKGRLLESVQQAQFILQKYSAAPEVWDILGSATLQMGDLDLSILAFTRVVELKPNYAVAHYNLGLSLQKKGRLDDAVSAYEKSLSLKPDYADAHFNMGNALKAQGELGKAVDAYKSLLSMDPSYADAYYNMGNALKDQGKLEAAIEAYHQAVSLKPDYAVAFSNMGNALKDQGKLEEAIDAYYQALSLKPDYAIAFNNMGVIFQEQGKIEEAIEVYNKALSLHHDYADATENRFSLLTQIKKSDLNDENLCKQAYSELTRETKHRPKSQIIAAIFSFLCADWSKARQHIQNFNACDPNLLLDLSLKDQVFCSAYYMFLNALLEKPFDDVSDFKNQSKIYHLGESHCLSYAHRSITMNELTFRVIPKITFGAKAFHFAKTKNNAFKAITRNNLAFIPKGSVVFISFGEIDCRPDEGFISAFKKLNEPIESLIASTVSGYLAWFAEQNKCNEHRMYFLNVPAPKYDKKYDAKLNANVANVVALFNAQIKKQTIKYGFNTIDVFGFTVGLDGFANGNFHIDERHLGFKAIYEIEKQFNK